MKVKVCYNNKTNNPCCIVCYYRRNGYGATLVGFDNEYKFFVPNERIISITKIRA